MLILSKSAVPTSHEKLTTYSFKHGLFVDNRRRVAAATPRIYVASSTVAPKGRPVAVISSHSASSIDRTKTPTVQFLIPDVITKLS